MTSNHFAIVLAAGASRRMGTCKTSLPWRGSTLLRYQAEQFLCANVQPIIVLGPHNLDRQEDCPPESKILVNPDPTRGKTSSIQTGLKALPQTWSNLFISAVDQPRESDIYQTLLKKHREQQAILSAPTHQGKLGHPLLFSRSLCSELNAISEETLGIRRIVQKFSGAIAKVEFSTPDVLADLNTPASYHSQSSLSQ